MLTGYFQNRRQFLKTAALGTAALSMSQTAFPRQPEGEKRPNILFILVDDLGYGDLSCYGAKDMKTPNIDTLFDAGIRYNNFYANCPVCSPTRASLLTGRYPDLVGVPGVIRTHQINNWGYLSPNAVMLPALLKKAAYKTAIIGKWHLGMESPNTPNERGFDFFHGFLGDMMDDYYHHRRHDINYMRLDNKRIDPKGHATDLFTQWAADYIKDQSESTKPFFLYLAYNAPHTPIQPPQEWLTKVKKRGKNITPDRAKLVALIEHLDDGIGRVLRALKDSGLDQNTLIIFTSDNGGQLNVGANNGDLNGGKQNMFEGGIKVPMCAVWPGHIKPGSVSGQTALTMDMFPTICAAAGVQYQHKIDGVNILPSLLGQPETKAPERTLFWVRREGNRHGGNAYYAARHGDWKLLQNTPFEPYKLFNLKEDSGEKNALDDSHPEYKKLFNELKKHIIRAGAVPWQKYPVEL